MPLFVWIAIAIAIVFIGGSAGVANMEAPALIEKAATKAAESFLYPLGWGFAIAVVIISIFAGIYFNKKK